MKFVTCSFRSLANKVHILTRQADIFGCALLHIFMYATSTFKRLFAYILYLNLEVLISRCNYSKHINQYLYIRERNYQTG